MKGSIKPVDEAERETMIVACLNGGLGNQMFQYAAARSLADRLGEDLHLDIRDLTHYQGPGEVHRFRLGTYPLRAVVASGPGLAARGFFLSRRLRRLVINAGLLRGDHFQERGFAYQPLTVAPGRFTYLEGYWQSWKYFSEDKKNILADLTLAAKDGPSWTGLLEKMEKENSVCLHVRLGDYVRSKAVADVHGNLTGHYYQEAIKRIRKMGTRFSFYLFSDEPQEALKLFKNKTGIKVVLPNKEAPQEDLRLMSACRYFVTANSSFSWWGAWLSQRAGKRVIAPRKWFVSNEKDTRDLIPPDWTTI